MRVFESTIVKECIADLPLASANCQIIIVDTVEAVEAAVDDLASSRLIGFDTETKPNFQRGENNTVSLLQLANAERCYLFRLKMIGANKRLKALLEDDTVLKVGLSVRDDFRALNRWMAMEPSNFIELQSYVQAFGIEEKSLLKIFAIVFGQKISKKQQLSNWEAPELTQQQQLYAATDAWACRHIYLELRKQV